MFSLTMFMVNRMFTTNKVTALVAIASVVGFSCGQADAQYYQYQQPQNAATPQVAAANWAQALFPVRNHDFGTVARAAKAEHVFEFTNQSDQPIEMLSVTPSCTCTLPEVPTRVVQPGEKGQIIAKFQTRKFVGQRGATLNVSMKKGNQYGTALVAVKGYIRQDVVLHPEAMDLSKVISSQGADGKIKVLYAGRSDWKITDLKCSNEAVKVEAVETLRQNGRVEYELKAEIPKDSPTGRIMDVITVFTNDRNLASFPVPLNANVVQPIRLPETLEVNVSEGDTVLENLIIASGTEFQVIDFECETCPIKLTLDSQSKKVHRLEFQASGLQEGRSEHTLKLKTNHPDQQLVSVHLIMNVQTGK